MKHRAPFVRTRGVLIPADFGVRHYEEIVTKKNQGVSTTNISDVANNNGNAVVGSQMIDTVTPGYKTKSKKGLIINNPLRSVSSSAEVITAFSGTASHFWKKDPSKLVTGTIIDTLYNYDNLVLSDPTLYPAPDGLDVAYIKAEAINEAYANAHQRDVMGLVDIAESGKTLDMLRTQCGRLESIVRNGLIKTMTRKGMRRMGRNNRSLNSSTRAYQYKSKTALGQLSDVSGLWLELQYGVIPLMLSIEGLAKAIAAPIEFPDIRNTFRGSQSLTADQKLSVNNNWTSTSYPGYTLIRKYELDYYQHTYARAGVLTRYKPTLQARLGLEGRDVIPGIYELIPFSFVLDWALDIGTYLEAVTPVTGFKTDSSWVTLYDELIKNYRATWSPVTMENSTSVLQCNAVYTEHAIVIRQKVRSPGVVPRPPHFNGQLKSLTHFISGAALVLSRTLNSKTFRKSLAK